MDPAIDQLPADQHVGLDRQLARQFGPDPEQLCARRPDHPGDGRLDIGDCHRRASRPREFKLGPRRFGDQLAPPSVVLAHVGELAEHLLPLPLNTPARDGRRVDLPLPPFLRCRQATAQPDIHRPQIDAEKLGARLAIQLNPAAY